MPVTTAIDRVLVYDNGALITRIGRGCGLVEVTDLPLLLRADSIRISCSHRTSGLEELASFHVDPSTSARLREQALVLEQERHALSSLTDALQSALDDFHVPLSLEDEGHDHGAAFANAWHWQQGLVAARQHGHDRIAALDAQKTDIERRLAVVHEQGAHASRGRVLRGIRFEIAAATEVDFAVEYFVDLVRCDHSYVLTLPQNDEPPRLVRGARVSQATGEPWLNAQVVIAGGDLQRSNATPPTRSWRLGAAQAPVATGFRLLPDDLPMLFTGYDRFTAVTPAPMKMRQAPVVAEPLYDDEPEADDDSAFAESTADELASFERQLSPPRAKLEGMRESQPIPRMASAGAPPLGRMMAPPLAPSPAPIPAKPTMAVSGVLKMMGPHEPHRGQLRTLDQVEELLWLLGDVPTTVTTATIGQLLNEAQQRAHGLLHGTNSAAPELLPLPTAPLSPGCVHIRDDGAAVFVERATESVRASVVHEVVPRHSLEVHRVVHVPAAVGQATLPPGRVDVFVGDEWVAQAPLHIGDKGTWQVSLGVDPLVRVRSRVVDMQQGEKGLMGGQTKVTQTVRLQLQSDAPTPVLVRVYERIPIADPNVKSADVVIALEAAEPPPSEQGVGPTGLLSGGLVFQQRLLPREQRTIDYRYSLQFASKLEVVGGARREASSTAEGS